MKNTYLMLVLCFIVATIGCEKEEPIANISPGSISIIKGNNQVGYPLNVLPDTIVLEIVPKNTKDLAQYSYYFTSTAYNTNLDFRDTIVDDKLLIYVGWKLGYNEPSQKITFYLIHKSDESFTNAEKIDSLTISASLKIPWKETFAGADGPLNDIHFLDDNNGILIGDLIFGQGYFKTSDGGKTWNSVKNSRNDLYQLCFSDSKTGFVIVTSNWAYFTNDGGQSFHEGVWTPPIIGHQSSSDYYMFNSNQIISIGGNATIAKSINGGSSWSTYNGFSFKNSFSDITCIGNDTCYVCGSVGKVVKTTDAGQTWKSQEILLNNDLKKIYFLDDQYGFAAGQNGALVKTSDGGENWQIISTGLRFTIIDIHFYTHELGYVVSFAGEIGKTTDGGRSWKLINKDSYGVHGLKKALFIGNAILGLQGNSIFTYDLTNE